MMEATGSSETSLHFYQTVRGSHPGWQRSQLVLSTDPYFEYFCHIPTNCGILTPFCWAGKTACLQHRKYHKSYSIHCTWKSWYPPNEISPKTRKSNKQAKCCSIPVSLSSGLEISLCPGRKCKYCSLYTHNNHSPSFPTLTLLVSLIEYNYMYLIAVNLDTVYK